jgi:dihydrofolate synthase/folylpolyglutamate synthase
LLLPEFNVTFDESVSYLTSLGNEVSAMKLGLGNIRKLLAALENPENNFLKVQVAGTNGKGSTCVFLDSICREAGIKTGLYTSPHLISVTERIKIDGREISEEDFARHATLVRETAEKLFAAGGLVGIPPFFEQVTAIALSAFAEANIELAILETGLGGRLDATTAANAEIAAITPIDFDHQQYLGETIEEIAAEKAAIIRQNSKAFIAPQKPEAEGVIRRRCQETGVVPVFSTAGIDPSIKLKIPGRHQIINAALAANVAEALPEFGFTVSAENIVNGLENAVHPGRLEYLNSILFDGAHNPAGARALANYLEESVTAPVTLIFGAMSDKNVSEIASFLFPRAEYLILTAIDNSRAATTDSLLKLVPAAFPKDNVFLTQTSLEALETARKITGKEGLVCVTGSLYLVGEIQKILKTRL